MACALDVHVGERAEQALDRVAALRIGRGFIDDRVGMVR